MLQIEPTPLEIVGIEISRKLRRDSYVRGDGDKLENESVSEDEKTEILVRIQRQYRNVQRLCRALFETDETGVVIGRLLESFDNGGRP